eukprot:gene7519-5301_t
MRKPLRAATEFLPMRVGPSSGAAAAAAAAASRLPAAATRRALLTSALWHKLFLAAAMIVLTLQMAVWFSVYASHVVSPEILELMQQPYVMERVCYVASSSSSNLRRRSDGAGLHPTARFRGLLDHRDGDDTEVRVNIHFVALVGRGEMSASGPSEAITTSLLSTICVDLYSAFENVRERWYQDHNGLTAMVEAEARLKREAQEAEDAKKERERLRLEEPNTTTTEPTSTPGPTIMNGDAPWKMEKAPFHHRNPRIYSGDGAVFVGRVWAVKEVLRAMESFVLTRYPADDMEGEWVGTRRERSIMAMLEAELVRFEGTSGLLSATSYTNESEVAASSPFALTPGVMGLDYRQEFVLSLQPPATAFLNARDMSGRQRETIMEGAFAELVGKYTSPVNHPHDTTKTLSPVDPEKTGISRSPSGVLLAPITFSATAHPEDVKGLPLYKNWSLDGSDGVIDISVPRADAVPVAYRVNRTETDLWQSPLETNPADAKREPQLTFIRDALAAAPPFLVWSEEGRGDCSHQRQDAALPSLLPLSVSTSTAHSNTEGSGKKQKHVTPAVLTAKINRTLMRMWTFTMDSSVHLKKEPEEVWLSDICRGSHKKKESTPKEQ